MRVGVAHNVMMTPFSCVIRLLLLRGVVVYSEFLGTRVAAGKSSQASSCIPERLLPFASLPVSCFISLQGEELCI